jgi:hypothetical protein
MQSIESGASVSMNANESPTTTFDVSSALVQIGFAAAVAKDFTAADYMG